MTPSLIVIWCSVMLYLVWVHTMAAWSVPPVPGHVTVMPSMMAVVLGAGLSVVVCLKAGGSP